MSVLVLGAASWNRMVRVERFPSGPSATIFGQEREAAGSTGTGKAMALAGLGHRPVFHCALGRDREARLVRAACKARGIRMVVDEQDGATPCHLNIMNAAGERHSIFLENGPDRPVLDRARLAGLIGDAGTIFLSLCNSSLAALDLLQGARAEVHLDLHDWDGTNGWHRPFIPHADVVQLSDVALADPEPVIAELLSGRTRQVVLTRAERGAEIITARERIAIPPVEARLVDSNGAGDAFAVALWHGQAKGWPPDRAGRFAAAAAAFSVEDDSLWPAGLTEAAILARAGLPA